MFRQLITENLSINSILLISYKVKSRPLINAVYGPYDSSGGSLLVRLDKFCLSASKQRVTEHISVGGFEKMDVVLQAAVCRVRLLQPLLHVLQLALEASLHLGNKSRDTLLHHNITFFSPCTTLSIIIMWCFSFSAKAALNLPRFTKRTKPVKAIRVSVCLWTKKQEWCANLHTCHSNSKFFKAFMGQELMVNN